MVYKLKFVALIVGALSAGAIAITAAFGAFPSSGSFNVCNGNTYFVSAAGNDANCGNAQGSPWRTVSKVNGFTFPINSVVKFRGGDTFSGGVVLPRGNMTITSYGVGQPTITTDNATACITSINFSNITINNIICTGGGNTTNTTDGIAIYNQIDNTTLNNITVTNNTVTQYGRNCVAVFAGTKIPTLPNAGFNTVNVSNNTIHECNGNSSNFIDTSCLIVSNRNSITQQTNIQNVTINNNLIYNCYGTVTLITGGGSGYGMQLAQITNMTISGNIIHDFGTRNGDCGGPGGIVIGPADQVTVKFNEVYNGSDGNNDPTTCDGGGLDFDTHVTNSIIEYNYVHNNTNEEILSGDFQPSGLGNNHNTFRFNIIEAGPNSNLGGKGGAFVFDCNAGVAAGCSDYRVYNNTIYTANSATTSVDCFHANAPNSTPFVVNFSNNICDAGGNNTAKVNIPSGSGVSLTFTGNDYFGLSLSLAVLGTTYTSLATFQTAGFEKVSGNPVGTTADPQLRGPAGGANLVCSGAATCPKGYQLLPTSPLVPNAGLNLNTLYSFSVGTQDFFGNAVTAATLPIGAAANTTLPVACANSGNTYNGPGDVISGAEFWYGLRSYSNSQCVAGQKLVAIQNNGTSETCDVLPSTTTGSIGNLANCSAGSSGTSSIAYCDAATCNITKFYDQSGATNCTTACDLSSVSAGKLLPNCSASLPCIIPSGASVGYQGTLVSSLPQPNTNSSVWNRSTNTGSFNTILGCGGDNGHTGANEQFGSSNAVNTALLYALTVNSITGVKDGITHAGEFVINGASSILYYDGLNSGTISSGAGDCNAQNKLIWFASGINAFGGFIMESGIWPSAFNATQAGNMCANQRSFWGSTGTC